MKNFIYPVMLLICSMLLVTCGRESVDPNIFRDPELPKDNSLTIRDNTYVMKEGQQHELISVSIGEIRYAASSSFAQSLKPGDIMVNPFGETNGFLRKITSITMDGDQLIFSTSLVQMSEAFSAWVIDSRTDKLTIKGRSPWENSINFGDDDGLVDYSFGGIVIPSIQLNINYNDFGFEYRWDENDPQYVNGPYMRLFMYNLNLQMTGHVTASFEGQVGFTASPETPFLLTEIPYANFLSLYFSPNLNMTANFEGTFTSPTMGGNIGPFNVSCGYDNVTGSLFWHDLPNPTITPLFTVPVIDNLSGTFKPTMGIEFIVAPTGWYESGAADIAEARLSFNAYLYSDFVFLHRGTFDDRQPRISFDAKKGIGFNVGVNFNLFDGLLTRELNSDDYEYQTDQWNIANLNTCDAFPSAEITYSGGLIDIGISSGGGHGLGYQVYANDHLISDQVYGYDQSNTIDLPASTTQLVNKIAIVDVNSFGCYLEDIYVDPSLVGNCLEKFVDQRDGNSYCTAEIGGFTWMTENLRYTNAGATGKWYNNVDSDENLVYGRLYTFSEIGDICPMGWHLPDNVDWSVLINSLGGYDQFGKNAKAKSSVLWPGANLPDVATFGAVPAGEYYSWLEGSVNYPAFGNKGKFARYWSSSLQDGSPTLIEIPTSDEAVRHTGESANQIGLSQFKSIRDIGFSCRCVKD